MSELSDRLAAGAVELLRSAQATSFRGPDAYDGLWSHWPRPLVAGRRRRQVVVQLHARSPVDIRRLYRRSHPLIPKAVGIFGSVGLRAHLLTGDESLREGGLAALELLDADRSAGDVAWGYPFDVQTRWSFYPAGSPNVVVTSFGASALLEAEQRAGRADLGARARSAASWVLDELWQPAGFFAYHPTADVNVHNANLLGAALVHRALGDDPTARERVSRAVERTLAAQLPDGSFPYGEGPGLTWADSFHTGFVLSCLAQLSDVDPAIEDSVRVGARAYEPFFDARGRAKLWADKEYPEDAHSAGTGLSTLAALVARGAVERELVERVGRRVLDAGLRNGHAVHRRNRWGRSTVRYIRWCDAHMALGLIDAAAVLREGRPAEAAAVARP